ncbi:MAG: hypothetical protein F9K29_21765 [Hyphomicrobiaceae bacterium]|nr:MAG: hypothetical protein F9K29_21765 [Hyphomicrobiaceae bacterium]
MTTPARLLRGVAGTSRDRLAGIVLVLVATIMASEAVRTLPIGSMASPGPGYLPLATAAALGGLGLLIAMRGGGPTLAALAWTEARHALLLLGGCAFAAAALNTLGYRLTMFLLVGFFLGIVERKHPLAALAWALGLSLGSFYLFSDLLLVALPRDAWVF